MPDSPKADLTDEELSRDPEFPYFRRVTCPLCGFRRVVQCVVDGMPLHLTVRRILRRGCYTCTPD